jgi:hypothetical protein
MKFDASGSGHAMTCAVVRSYTELLVATCCSFENLYPGDADYAFHPNRRDWKSALAITRVHEDKRREATGGFDGTWVAHPGLVATAREFDAVLGDQPNSSRSPTTGSWMSRRRAFSMCGPSVDRKRPVECAPQRVEWRCGTSGSLKTVGSRGCDRQPHGMPRAEISRSRWRGSPSASSPKGDLVTLY